MTDWAGWQRSWDQQQESYLPDREERFRVMLDSVAALAGDQPRILDLACGTGTITARALDRFPGAGTTGVDRDPALLAIARGSMAGAERADWCTADLRDPAWPEELPHRTYDAVLTATALHWMQTEELRTLYGQLASLLRPGGVFLNADHMPQDGTPRIDEALDQYDQKRRDRARAAGSADWAGWWQKAAEAPELSAQAAKRFALIGDPVAGDHSDGEAHPPDWHVRSLREAGFAEARTVWAAPFDAMVLALR